MANTPLTIVNQALLHIGGGDIPQINSADWPSGTSSPNAATIAMATLYTPAVQAALREIRPAFAQKYAALALSGNVAPAGWTYEYLLPADSVSFLTVKAPQSGVVLDPKPTRFREGTAIFNSAETTVIWTNIATAVGSYISGLVQGVLPLDAIFQGDALFQECVVRFLASAGAEALAGRFDVAKRGMEDFFTMSQIADMRADA